MRGRSTAKGNGRPSYRTPVQKTVWATGTPGGTAYRVRSRSNRRWGGSLAGLAGLVRRRGTGGPRVYPGGLLPVPGYGPGQQVGEAQLLGQVLEGQQVAGAGLDAVQPPPDGERAGVPRRRASSLQDSPLAYLNRLRQSGKSSGNP